MFRYFYVMLEIFVLINNMDIICIRINNKNIFLFIGGYFVRGEFVLGIFCVIKLEIIIFIYNNNVFIV